MTVKLKGIAWNHSRGIVPVVATAQRFTELNPTIEITWEKRSLQHFADYPIDKLADKYDLLVIDHPWAGFAASKDILINLEQHLSKEYLIDQANNSVGQSYESYNFNGNQVALAIDACTPIATYRKDLFKKGGRKLPETWEDLLELAKEKKVAFASTPIDSLMNFYMLCVTQGEKPFLSNERVVSDDMGMKALEQLRELASYCSKDIFSWNPIKVYDVMSTENEIYYCPFAYGYSNYSRRGYSKYILSSTDMVSIGHHGKLISTLGGTGLAISKKSNELESALKYLKYTASPEIQKTIYFDSGGHPGHRDAWRDEEVNRRSDNAFKNTLPAHDRAFLRPRYTGYFHFQDHAGDIVRDYMKSGGDSKKTMMKINKLYKESKSSQKN